MAILLIEDDAFQSVSLTRSLREAGYVVGSTYNGEAGLAAATANEYELIIQSDVLPDMDGLEVVRRLKKTVAAPVIVLTSMSNIVERVEALDAGADDCLVRPIHVDELLARIRVLARRQRTTNPVLTAGNISLDPLSHTVTRAGKPLKLSPQEFRLLEYLVRNVDKAVSRKMLLQNVWNIHFDPQTSVVESHISRLRSNLNRGFERDAIQTLRGVGYKLRVMN